MATSMLSRFPGTCTACGCKFPQGAPIIYTRGVGARHEQVAQCAAAKRERLAAQQPALVELQTLDLKPIVAFLERAKSNGLKRPKLRVLHMDGRTEVRLGLTVAGAAPGSLSVVVGTDYVGSVRPDGTVSGARLFNSSLKSLRDDLLLQKHLLQVALNPTQAAKEYAAVMCVCSFCGKALTDAGSVQCGYGPICAQHWNLPHFALGTPALSRVV